MEVRYIDPKSCASLLERSEESILRHSMVSPCGHLQERPGLQGKHGISMAGLPVESPSEGFLADVPKLGGTRKELKEPANSHVIHTALARMEAGSWIRCRTSPPLSEGIRCDTCSLEGVQAYLGYPR